VLPRHAGGDFRRRIGTKLFKLLIHWAYSLSAFITAMKGAME
jgi:hypothetical protein